MARHKWRRIADELADRVARHAHCGEHPAGSPVPGCPACRDRAAYRNYLDAGGGSRDQPTPAGCPPPGPAGDPVPAAPRPAAAYQHARALRGRSGGIVHALRPGASLAACGARAVALSPDAVPATDLLITCGLCERQVRYRAVQG